MGILDPVLLLLIKQVDSALKTAFYLLDGAGRWMRSRNSWSGYANPCYADFKIRLMYTKQKLPELFIYPQITHVDPKGLIGKITYMATCNFHNGTCLRYIKLCAGWIK